MKEIAAALLAVALTPTPPPPPAPPVPYAKPHSTAALDAAAPADAARMFLNEFADRFTERRGFEYFTRPVATPFPFCTVDVLRITPAFKGSMSEVYMNALDVRQMYYLPPGESPGPVPPEVQARREAACAAAPTDARYITAPTRDVLFRALNYSQRAIEEAASSKALTFRLDCVECREPRRRLARFDIQEISTVTFNECPSSGRWNCFTYGVYFTSAKGLRSLTITTVLDTNLGIEGERMKIAVFDTTN